MGPGVTGAHTVRAWHVGQSGRRMITMLRLGSGGSDTDVAAAQVLARDRTWLCSDQVAIAQRCGHQRAALLSVWRSRRRDRSAGWP